MMPGPSGPVRVRLAHEAAGRLRLRLANRLDAAGCDALADRLAACPGVRRVAVRPNTGSVIIEAGRGAADLRQLVEGLDFLKLLPPAKPVPVGQMAKLGEMLIDQNIRKRSEGALDLKASLALVLVFLAVVQVFRGQLAGPATTLLFAALQLMEQSKP